MGSLPILKPREAVRILERLGFVQVRQRGSDWESDALVSQVMHAMQTLDMRTSLREAAAMMINNHHHRVVGVDKSDPDSFPLGIVSSFDIVAEMARPGSVWQT